MSTVLRPDARPVPRGRRLVPGLATARGVALVPLLVLAGLASNLFSGNAWRIGLPLGPDRLLLGAAILMALLEGRRRAVPARVEWLMLAFSAWVLLSMLTHPEPFDSVAVYGFVDRVAMPFVLFALGGVVFSTPERRDLLLAVLTAIGLWLGLTALLEIAEPGLVLPRYVVDPDIGLGFGRARGPFLSPEGMGAALALCGAAAVALAVRRPRWRTLAGAVALLDLVGVGLALTRAMWIAAALALVVAFVLAPALRRVITSVVVAGGVGLFSLLAAVPAASTVLTERGSDARPVYDRLGSNEAAGRILADLPWTGIGWRRFFPEAAEWVRQADTYPINNVVIEVHNVLLSRAAELGIPAAVCFVAVLVLGPFAVLGQRPQGDLAVWRVLSVACLTVWVVGGFFGPMATPFPTFVAWLVAGVALGSAAVPVTSRRTTPSEEALA
ncbi:O-antigen ligase family protein [Arthrobacter sp. NEB 688]|uniref:O-antigen ligase family protein n=1 Tax=Arthrobacter sp. NEB 688 TaxID=904039 RepID=UPI0015638FBC|nr:O-antigen ligase family protein [Arthrobacter sp. NEB 688]QKE85311.1 hypothetical protein HL663_16105 [Arthrobacter sp. NEB 688]